MLVQFEMKVKFLDNGDVLKVICIEFVYGVFMILIYIWIWYM